jgi:hypothetical protein
MVENQRPVPASVECTPPGNGETKKNPSCFKRMSALGGIVLSVAVLLNLTLGVVEIPDALPIVGHVDEFAAAALLFSCLRYLGFDGLPFSDRVTRTRKERA